MPTIKEFREFFIRSIPVSVGSKADQEVGYPTYSIVDGINKYNRFLDKNRPTEGVFKKFLESIAFKLNPEDTASNSIQGLVKTCTNVLMHANSNKDSDDFVLMPSIQYVNGWVTGNTFTRTGNASFTVSNSAENQEIYRAGRPIRYKATSTDPWLYGIIYETITTSTITCLISGIALHSSYVLMEIGDFRKVVTKIFNVNGSIPSGIGANILAVDKQQYIHTESLAYCVKLSVNIYIFNGGSSNPLFQIQNISTTFDMLTAPLLVNSGDTIETNANLYPFDPANYHVNTLDELTVYHDGGNDKAYDSAFLALTFIIP